METNNFEEINKKLEKLMYGHNYVAGFKFHIFNNCNNELDFINEVKANCSEFSNERGYKILHNANDFWDAINYGLNYRGDEAAGLSLSPAEEKELQDVQNDYKKFIKDYIKEDTQIYTSANGQGVFWGYNLFIKNRDKSLHISAFADD